MAKEIYAAKCKKCGKVIYPTHYYCPACNATKFESIPITGNGKLLSWTRAYALPMDYAKLYITLGVVELDMGIKATGQLDIAEPKTGMRVCTNVDVVRETMGTDIDGLVFREA